MEKSRVDFDSLPRQRSLQGARHKVFQNNNLEGEMDIDFNGNIVRFSTGDGLFIPEGNENRRKASVISDVVRLILVEDA